MPHQCTECGRTFADGSKEMLSGCPDCGGNKFQFAPASEVADAAGSQSADAAGSTGRSTGAAAAPDDARSSRAREEPRDSTTTADADDGRTEWPTHGDEPEAAERSKPVSPTEADNYSPTASDAEADDPRGDRAESRSATEHTESRSTTGEPGGTAGSSERDSTEFVDSDDAGAGEDSAQASARSDVVSPDELSVANRNAGSGPDGNATAPRETGADATSDTTSDTTSDAPAETDPGGAAGHERPELDDLREELNDQFESIRIVSPGKYELNLMELYDSQEYIISLQEDGRYVIEMPNSIEERSG